jgi:hypothetical protein
MNKQRWHLREQTLMVEIMPLDQARDEGISRRQIELLRKAPGVAKLLYKTREELYDR